MPFETHRLRLRPAQLTDAEFIFNLVNEPDWLRFIGDKKVNNKSDAENYIRNSLQVSYETNGYGLYLIEQLSDDAPVGLCGLVNRPELPHIDLGYALHSTYRKQGFAREAAIRIMQHAVDDFNFKTLLAITTPDNLPSINLLLSLGFLLEQQSFIGDSDELSNVYRHDNLVHWLNQFVSQ
jgi:RimJ/RimL family protein N-acetyltransferase